jgi:hypothetical protein
MTFATILFTSVKGKSKATKTIILIFFFHTFHHLAYVFGFSFYHPIGAYHRWFSVFSVLPAILYMTQFFFHFPGEWALKKARIVLIVQWIISITVTVYFIFKSFSTTKVYRLTHIGIYCCFHCYCFTESPNPQGKRQNGCFINNGFISYCYSNTRDCQCHAEKRPFRK